MLCDTCINLFRGEFSNAAREHHGSPHALSCAVQNHCYVCAKVLNTILDELKLGPDIPKLEVLSRIEYNQQDMTDGGQEEGGPFTQAQLWSDSSWPNPYGQSIRLQIMGGYVYKSREGNSIKVPSQAKWFGIIPKNELESLIQSELPDRRTDAESTLKLAKKWLSSCRTNHSLCTKARSATSRTLPTRLLEIKGSSHTAVVSLISSSDVSPAMELEYFTLSHCWGQSQFLELNGDTHLHLKSGINVSSLPQTFRDAIQLTQRLGGQYIWIDSLCISQDSISDWEHESSLMGDIYAGGVCNIAAAGAPNTHSECFFERDPLLVPPCMVHSDWSDRKNEEYHLFQLDWWGNEMGKSPLLKRGWVVQELFLSPRVLYLNREQIGWQCFEVDACETYPNGLPDCVDRRRIERHWLSGLPPKSFPAKKKHADDSLTQGPEDFWNNILQTYCKCKLTKSHDKLVALTGIAKKMEKVLNDDYLAGLWRSRLPSLLLWYTSGERLRPAEYGAPSWSWASMDGDIWIENFDAEHTLIEVIDAQVSTPIGNESGQVIGGYIRLRGPLTTMEIAENFFPGMKQCRFYNKDWDGNLTTAPTPDFDEPADHIHCLPVKGRGPDGIPTRCLLLKPTGLSTGQFRRFGIMEVVHTVPKAFQNWTGWKNFQSHEWLEYEEFDGVDCYTISII